MKKYTHLINAIQKLGYEYTVARTVISNHISARANNREAFSTPLIRSAIRLHRQHQAASKPGYSFIEYRYAQSRNANQLKYANK